jgi:hypothetical protein
MLNLIKIIIMKERNMGDEYRLSLELGYITDKLSNMMDVKFKEEILPRYFYEWNPNEIQKEEMHKYGIDRVKKLWNNEDLRKRSYLILEPIFSLYNQGILMYIREHKKLV